PKPRSINSFPTYPSNPNQQHIYLNPLPKKINQVQNQFLFSVHPKITLNPYRRVNCFCFEQNSMKSDNTYLDLPMEKQCRVGRKRQLQE
ncbi:hypothetical protein M758_UG252600, partial [Ceratodon purpureus]